MGLRALFFKEGGRDINQSTHDKENPMIYIRSLAIKATEYLELFNEHRGDCELHAFNTLTKDHNCFYGNTKTKCDALLCPFKEKRRFQ